MPESAVESILSQVNNLSPDERKALLAALSRAGIPQATARRSALGKHAGLVTPVGEFLRMKHEETVREENADRP